MKRRNTMWKRLSAMAIALIMVLQCFGGISIVSQAADSTDYTELTYSDLTGSQFQGVSTNLNGCAFTAKVTFTDGGYFRIAGADSVGGWKSTLQVRLYADLNGKGPGLYLRWSDSNDKGIATNAIYSDEFAFDKAMLLRMEFDLVNDTDVQVKMYIENILMKTMTFANVAEHFGRYLVSSGVTFESVKDYYEFTFSDAGVKDTTTNKSGQIKGLSTMDGTAFRGKVTYADRTDTGTDASPWNDKLFIGTGSSNYWDETGSLYLYYHHTQERLYINKSTFVSVPKENVIGKTIEYYITFDVVGDATKIQIYMDGTLLKTHVLATVLPGFGIHAYSANGTMSIESVVTQPTYEKTIGFGDLANYESVPQTITYETTQGVWTPEDTSLKTLSKVAFEDYISFSDGAGQKAFLYIGNENGDTWKGIRVYQSSGTTYVQYHGDSLTTIVDANNSTYGIEDGKQFVLKVGIEYHYATDVVIYVWLNQQLAGKMRIDGVAQDMGTGIEAKVTATGYTMVCGESNELPYEEYKRLTPLDFGYSDFTFKPGVHGSQATAHTKKALTADGSVTDLHETYLDIDLKCNDTTGNDYLIYASSDGWKGICIRWRTDSFQIFSTYGGGEVYTYNDSYTGIVAGETFNLKLYTKVSESTITVRAIVTSVTKTFEIKGLTFSVLGNAGNQLAVYTTGGTISVATPVTKTENIGPYSYDLEDGNYLVVEKNATLNGEALAVGSELSQPGDYVLTLEQDGVEIKKTVVLYQVGDVNLDGQVATEGDLTALQTILANATDVIATTAPQFGADLDNDNKVGQSDLKLMKAIISGETTLDAVKEKYHVAALSYDYLGGDEVMPIVGYYGPYKTSSGNYISDEIMEQVKNSGVNVANFTPNSWGYSSYNLNLLDELRQYSKHGIGYYVSHYDWISDTTVAQQLVAMSNYGNYSAFIGSHLVDEPNAEEMADWYELAAYLNKYTNTNGFINLAPEDNPDVTDAYDAYWSNYIENANPKVLSVDDYPFNDSADEGVTNATGYFKTLATVRANAGNQIPFWYYVQAGGDFTSNWSTVNMELQPTVAETHWNVNTALAFGAKGIEWFPLIQPTAYATAADETTDYNKNGLIGADAAWDATNAKTDFYDTAVLANKQISVVDEVLMKASSKGIIATGGYASSQTAGLTGMIDVSGTEKLVGVTADDADYGALIGCFDYKDTEAYYVVNYSVDAEQNVVLNFNDKYTYRMMNYNGTVSNSGTSCILTIPAGEAVLVVLDKVATVQAPVEIYPSDFAVEDGTYTNTTGKAAVLANGTYAPTVQGDSDATLNGTVFSADVILSGNARINLGHKSSTYYGVSLMTDTRSGHEKHLMMRWEESGNTSGYTHFLNPEKVGLTSFVGEEYNLKISMELVDSDGDGYEDDLKVGIYFNDILYPVGTEDSFVYYLDRKDSFGTILALRADTTDSYVKMSTPKLDIADYDTVTTTDIGLAQAIYNPYSGNCQGRYDGESMDGVLFSVNLDFKGSTSSYIRFAGTDAKKWNAMQFEQADGNLYLDTKNMTTLGYTRYRVNCGAIPSELFNLRISTEYVDFDRDGLKDDVKMGVWIDGQMTNNNRYIYYIDMVPYIGNNVIFNATYYAKGHEKNPFDYTITDEFTVLAAPITKELPKAAYDLTGTDGYMVPNTEIIYQTPGDYEVEFSELGTIYSGDVSLYYEGDANMDGVADIRDLVRLKIRTNPYQVFTFSDAGTINLDKTSMIEGDLAGLTATDKVAFRGSITYADRTDTAADGAPYNDRLYIGTNDSWAHAAGLYIYYNHNTNEIAVNGKDVFSVDAVADTLIGKTVEYYITFETNDTSTKAIIYIEHVKVGEVELTAVGNRIHAYSANGTMTVASVEAEEVVQKGTAAFESTDVDHNGVLQNEDSIALRNVLVDKSADKEVVFGVISDTHFLGNGGDAERQERFEKALNYYRGQGAELIIMNADLTDHGEIGGYKALVNIVNEVYKDTPVEFRPQFVATADNHEFYEAWDWTTWGESISLDTVASRFATYMSELDTQLVAGETNLNTSRTIHGYTFIGVSRDGENTASAAYAESTITWLDAELAKAQEANPDKPIFVAIHQPPTDTVSASGTDGTDGYDAILAKYPQVVLFTSHTHAPLEDEHSLYQGDYTVVNTGSVYYVGGLGSDINGGVDFQSSSTTGIYDFAQALLVRANGTQIEIERCNFLGNEPALIKYNWVFDVADKDSFAAYTEQRKDTEAPTFASDAVVTYNNATGVVTFRAAMDNDFVYYYEITVDGIVYNYLTDFYQGIWQMDTECSFTLNGVTAESVIEIRAVDAYGNVSEAITN